MALNYDPNTNYQEAADRLSLALKSPANNIVPTATVPDYYRPIVPTPSTTRTFYQNLPPLRLPPESVPAIPVPVINPTLHNPFFSYNPLTMLTREQVIQNFLSKLSPDVRARFEKWFAAKKDKTTGQQVPSGNNETNNLEHDTEQQGTANITPVPMPPVKQPTPINLSVPALELLKSLLLKINTPTTAPTQ